MLSLSKLARTLALVAVIVTLTLPARAADLDKLAPADAEAAVVINIKNFLSSKLFKKYGEDAVKEALKTAEAAKFIEATGLDPLKDLDSITVTGTGIGNPDGKAVVLVKGNFNVAKLQATVEAEAKKAGQQLKTTKDGGQTYYTITPPKGPEVTGTFVGNDAIVISNNADYLKQVAGGKMVKPTEGAKAFKGALGKVAGKETVYLVVAATDELKKQLSSTPKGKQFADKLDSVIGTVNVADAIDLGVAINTTDADAAKELRDLVKGAVPLLNLLGAGQPQAAPIIKALSDNLKISSEGKTVNLKLQLTEELLKSLQPGGN